MIEEWKDIEGYEGQYQVSNLGNVRSLNWRCLGFQRNLILRTHKDGYKQVLLSKNGKTRMATVHRLVANAFIPNPLSLPQVNHKDFNRANNDVRNLEWCTPSYNTIYSVGNRPKTRKKRTGNERHNNSIIQIDDSNKVVATWENCREIVRKTGFNATSVWECCDGKRKTAYGFIWKYVENG